MQSDLSSRIPYPAMLIAAALSFGSAGAQADNVTVYDNLAAFSAAVGGAETYDFPAVSDGRQRVASPFVVGPLSFAGFREPGTPRTILALGNDGEFGTGQSYLLALNAPELFGIEATPLQGSLYAVAFDVGTLFMGDYVNVTLNATQWIGQAITPPSPGSTFFGIVSTTPITQVLFSGENATELDILDFYLPAAVPEPSTLALMMLGGTVLLIARRRSPKDRGSRGIGCFA